MMQNKILITVLGWEERFSASNEIILEKSTISKIILICFQDYVSMSGMKENHKATLDLAKKNNIELKEIKLVYGDSVSNWSIFETFFVSAQEEYLLNITTIPRETIWTLFFFLKKSSNIISYFYFKPLKYSDTWLTRNHKNPRLLFKHSGLIDLDKKLALFIISGFDPARLEQIIAFYEPHKIILFAQVGEQFENIKRNCNSEITNLNGDIEILSIDSYDIKSATQLLEDKYLDLKDEFNIVIDSQGPKVSSLSVYDVYLKSEGSIALAYVPVKDFHPEYSSGINPDYISGSFTINRTYM